MTALDNVWYVEKLVLTNYHDCSIKCPSGSHVSTTQVPCPSATHSSIPVWTDAPTPWEPPLASSRGVPPTCQLYS